LKKSIPHIAIIGTGQLGSRHLQGLSSISQDINISVVDPNKKAIEIAKQRLNMMPSNTHVKSISYLNNLKDLASEIDLSIIATKSDVRRKIIEELLLKLRVFDT